MRMLFVGDTWRGSQPRSLREAFARRNDLALAEVSVEHRTPRMQDLPTRLVRRLLNRFETACLQREVLDQCEDFDPDVVLFYKGCQFDADFLKTVRTPSRSLVNVFPDYSPHAFGPSLAKAVETYDLVISTKPFHPDLWSSTYGYSNRCVCVPHGYDRELHLREQSSRDHEFDVVLVAGGRPEYHQLVDDLIAQPGLADLKAAIVGDAWNPIEPRLPRTWRRFPAQFGSSYVDWLRRGKIVIAPLHTQVVVDGVRQPGDVDTARTYEAAAAHCFFIHRRTPFMPGVYDEDREVPLFDDAAELGAKIRHFVNHEDERVAMAEAAHRRAVPAYSFDARAEEMMSWLQTL